MITPSIESYSSSVKGQYTFGRRVKKWEICVLAKKSPLIPDNSDVNRGLAARFSLELCHVLYITKYFFLEKDAP